MKQAFYCLALVLGLYACQGASRSTGQDSVATEAAGPASVNWPFTETRWKLKNFTASVAVPDSMPREVFVRFRDSASQVQGFLGCNGFGAKYVTDTEGNLRITDIISTKMACDHLDVENTLSQAMGATTRYTIEKDMLRLQQGDSIIATFQAIP